MIFNYVYRHKITIKNVNQISNWEKQLTYYLFGS